MIRRWLYAVFLAADLLASALTGGAPWQTISARLAKARVGGSPIGGACCRAVDWVVLKVFHERNHCEAAFTAYEARLMVARKVI